MSVFCAFLAARHCAILFSIFVLLIFIARWQINTMMMMIVARPEVLGVAAGIWSGACCGIQGTARQA